MDHLLSSVKRRLVRFLEHVKSTFVVDRGRQRGGKEALKLASPPLNFERGAAGPSFPNKIIIEGAPSLSLRFLEGQGGDVHASRRSTLHCRTLRPMPWGLKRYQQVRCLHFITFSCFHRTTLLASPQARRIFEH